MEWKRLPMTHSENTDRRSLIFMLLKRLPFGRMKNMKSGLSPLGPNFLTQSLMKRYYLPVLLLKCENLVNAQFLIIINVHSIFRLYFVTNLGVRSQLTL